MKKYLPLAFVAIVVTLISCNENEEPVSLLSGTWENREFVDSLDVWIVETIEFKNDSIFDLSVTVRDSETGPELGYRLVASSWYSFEGNTFKYYYSDALFYLSHRVREENILFVPKSELKPAIFDFFRIPEGVLTFSGDGKKFEFQENCIVFSSGVDCIEVPVKEYIRVN